ncbi:hypothetical protein [Janibacter melonis]|uniref:hypothetical protein n=1 Tax=Janibacter melonis TaxID=262209 RepID=UPI002095D2A7|nr:hypothetical protein [Janibacter melonis]
MSRDGEEPTPLDDVLFGDPDRAADGADATTELPRVEDGEDTPTQVMARPPQPTSDAVPTHWWTEDEGGSETPAARPAASEQTPEQTPQQWAAYRPGYERHPDDPSTGSPRGRHGCRRRRCRRSRVPGVAAPARPPAPAGAGPAPLPGAAALGRWPHRGSRPAPRRRPRRRCAPGRRRAASAR